MKGFILLMVSASRYAKGLKTISSYNLRSKITFFDLQVVQRLYKIKLFYHVDVAYWCSFYKFDRENKLFSKKVSYIRVNFYLNYLTQVNVNIISFSISQHFSCRLSSCSQINHVVIFFLRKMQMRVLSFLCVDYIMQLFINMIICTIQIWLYEWNIKDEIEE